MRVTAPKQIKEPEDLAFLSTAHLAQDTLEIDLTDVEWISPLGVIAVLATCLRADESSLGTMVVYLPKHRGAQSYLGTIGLLKELERADWTLAGRGGPEDVARAQMELPIWTEIGDTALDLDTTVGPHLPVSRLTTLREVDGAADRLEDVLKAVPHVRGGLCDELITVAVELTANAREHGSPCYAVAQVYTGPRSGTPGVQLAIGDFGVGIAQTLRRRYGPMEDGHAIMHAFEEQVSGTGRSDKGFGLYQVKEIVDNDPGGILHVISHAGHVVRSGRQFQVSESEGLLFRGTLASAYLPSGFPIIREVGSTS